MHTLDDLRSGALSGAKQVRLSGLTAFPEALYDLADTLEVLDLSASYLTHLPEDFARLHRLKIFFGSNNPFETLPPVLGCCVALEMVGFKSCRIREVPSEALPPRLRWLILTDNCIERLPRRLGDCADLQKLMLAGNRLTALPETIQNCRALELVRLAANQFETLPVWLTRLPRLSWLGLAGNPFAARAEAALARVLVADIAWSQLSLGDVLGEGASGTTYLGQLSAGDLSRQVAVKIFKGAMTSDGLPQSEMAACVAAGHHEGLIPVMGKVCDHPDGRSALVMERIDSDWCVLAGPPSLKTCTRDVYAEGVRFDVGTVLGIAQQIASAADHLHNRGILHGDLYAHNILHDGNGRACLGDFGAASAYDPADRTQAEALQRLEVRAFGCLLEELTRLCDAPEAMERLTVACLDVPEKRPLFTDIVKSLAAIAL
ncbi:protein kinase [Asticcacaulis excentricus]|uniref:Serine/threonine-protein kinase-like domain protein n=1 Tax=Asticcacaulis excentricus (strain ATCC 15261 / DSM 4724 / KCTC 12464 / NCIMB 9791 / VKM B-1370 / CB 48) TaxID=573065 RepID=E8RQR4_ASTEC|nr:leucine-rich repeat-containing protein kinase family protein [Asticcacaulis excentricus]ADU13292.1 Serine/threonine-protein kinase-like domain protein [Asticcacaulis excentricus CB 48]